MTIIDWFLAGVGIYALIGVLFALAFIVAGIARVDPAIAHSPRSVRLLLLPGLAGLWPIMLAKWIGASGRGTS